MCNVRSIIESLSYLPTVISIGDDCTNTLNLRDALVASAADMYMYVRATGKHETLAACIR